MDLTGEAIFRLAFGAGILHALDVDHAIAPKKLGVKAIDRLCLKWSIGHGVVLFIMGGVIIFGLSIPHELSQYAEKGAALLLIVIGSWILIDLYKSHSHIHFHQHEGLVNHAHWHQFH